MSLLVSGDMLLDSGSEVLLNFLGPRFGGIMFRIVRALPSMILMIVTAVSSDKENAQSQVSIAINIYAGVSVLSLTVIWIECLVLSSKPLKKEKKNKKKKKKKEEKETSKSNCFPAKEQLINKLIDLGAKIDQDTCKTAGIMLLSLIPYAVLLLVHVPSASFARRVVILIALIISSVFLISYLSYQASNPWMQNRCMDYSKFEIAQRRFTEQVDRLGELVKEGKLRDIHLIKRFFYKADREYKKIIDKEINEEEEFVQGLRNSTMNKSERRSRIIEEFDKVMWKEELPYGKKDLFYSIILVLAGSIFSTMGGPVTVNILELSKSMEKGTYLITFLGVPAVMNIRRVVAAARQPATMKRKRTAHLAFSELYGGVTMNNIAGLTTLLVIVYAKDLTWDFTAEVLTVMLVCSVIGVLAFRSKTYNLWTFIPVFLLHLISMGLFYLLQEFLGWN